MCDAHGIYTPGTNTSTSTGTGGFTTHCRDKQFRSLRRRWIVIAHDFHERPSMRISNLGGLGISDTDVLQPGTVISFDITGTPCSGIYEQDIRNGLNNWTGQMMNIVSVTTNASGYIPLHVNVTVTATVTNAVPAGDLRGQIISALDALSQSYFASTCVGGVSLADNVLNVAPGSTGTGAPPAPPSPLNIPWSTAAVVVAGVVGLLVVTNMFRR
jgi:hypothetical protein